LNDITTYILTHLRNTKYNTIQGHTTLLIYNKEQWKRFKSILSIEEATISKFLWSVVDMVVDQFDKKGSTLDSFLTEPIIPLITANAEKEIKPFLKTLDKEKLRELEPNIYHSLIYIMALQHDEPNLDNYVYLWHKYKI